ncbi:hypothetical protein QBC35DRAFT_516531 [Podospora australis]|uniref:DUF676 domain-containing protein n=1 Tax=Podospora australis TaxID=1536484 RepID=A0AAN7AG57_9PEZI|nr:hypothetical protein QBC35DRAFT_516531 [Podospora australis]
MHPLVSFAAQNGFLTATVSSANQKSKTRGLKTFASGVGVVDDTFEGLTVLHSAPHPQLDICAVHGLNGNAFDTWSWDGCSMWLRDFLPKSESQAPDLKQVRIMTFGYSSLLRDKTNITGLFEWSSELLRSVSEIRKTDSERSCPIVFVCHSLGGIGGRQSTVGSCFWAIVRLADNPELYPGLSLSHCGMLFHSTPHSGTDQENWSDLLTELAKIGGARRSRNFTHLLGSFNSESVRAKERFGLLNLVPPFTCVYETQKTMVKGIQRTIVTPDSAGLNGERAQPIRYADHRTICRNGGALISTSASKTLSTTASPSSRPAAAASPQDIATVARGGDAHGGDAVVERMFGGSAEGGKAMGGDAIARYGGKVIGGMAFGGSAVGGDASGSWRVRCLVVRSGT